MALKKLKVRKLKPSQPEEPKIEVLPEPAMPEPEPPKTKSSELRIVKLRKKKKKATPDPEIVDTIPEKESDSVSEDQQLSSVIDEPTFHGIPEADWRSVTQEEVRGMSIPELHGMHIDDDQKYLVVRMLASSKPATMADMHEILSESNPDLDQSERQYKVNALRLDDTVKLLTQRLAGDYLFEVRSRV